MIAEISGGTVGSGVLTGAISVTIEGRDGATSLQAACG